MDCREIRFSRHAIERMFQRAVTPEIAREIIEHGEPFASYVDDRSCVVMTVYRPDQAHWSDDFRRRRNR